MTEALVRCRCGALVPAEGIAPEHTYIDASPGCWILFTEIRAREVSDPGYLAHGRQTTDIYMVQHPGVPGRQSSQSVWVHLVGLYLVLERGMAPANAISGMRSILAGRPEFPWLEPPPSLGSITAADAHRAADAAAFRGVVRAWAGEAWRAWSPHHHAIRRLAERSVGA